MDDVGSRGLTAAASFATTVAAISARGDYESREDLSLRTQALMWPAYVLGGAVIARNISRSDRSAASLTRTLGAALAFAGGVALVLGAKSFESLAHLAGRGTGDLMTEGIYSYSRHPQYAGNVALAAGSALEARSARAAAFAAVVAASYRFYVPAEEAHLERIFGEEYERYRDKTPRWIGWRRR